MRRPAFSAKGRLFDVSRSDRASDEGCRWCSANWMIRVLAWVDPTRAPIRPRIIDVDVADVPPIHEHRGRTIVPELSRRAGVVAVPLDPYGLGTHLSQRRLNHFARHVDVRTLASVDQLYTQRSRHGVIRLCAFIAG